MTALRAAGLSDSSALDGADMGDGGGWLHAVRHAIAPAGTLARGAVGLALVVGISPQVNAQPPVVAATSFVLDSATVVDVEHGKLIPSHWVMIVENRIRAVGNVSAVKMPNDAQVVQASGKYR